MHAAVNPVFRFGWSAVFPSRPEHSKARRADAVKDGLASLRGHRRRRREASLRAADCLARLRIAGWAGLCGGKCWFIGWNSSRIEADKTTWAVEDRQSPIGIFMHTHHRLHVVSAVPLFRYL